MCSKHVRGQQHPAGDPGIPLIPSTQDGLIRAVNRSACSLVWIAHSVLACLVIKLSSYLLSVRSSTPANMPRNMRGLLSVEDDLLVLVFATLPAKDRCVPSPAHLSSPVLCVCARSPPCPPLAPTASLARLLAQVPLGVHLPRPAGPGGRHRPPGVAGGQRQPEPAGPPTSICCMADSPAAACSAAAAGLLLGRSTGVPAVGAGRGAGGRAAAVPEPARAWLHARRLVCLRPEVQPQPAEAAAPAGVAS